MTICVYRHFFLGRHTLTMAGAKFPRTGELGDGPHVSSSCSEEGGWQHSNPAFRSLKCPEIALRESSPLSLVVPSRPVPYDVLVVFGLVVGFPFIPQKAKHF